MCHCPRLPISTVCLAPLRTRFGRVRMVVCRLVWITEADWLHLRDVVELGTTVRVRVSRLLDAYRFRFPLELQLIKPDISDQLTVPPPDNRPMIFYAHETPEQWADAQACPLPSARPALRPRLLPHPLESLARARH